MARFSMHVEGMDEVRRGLRAIEPKMGKEVGKVHKQLGARIKVWAEAERSQMAGQFPSYGSRVVKVKPSANQRRVMLTIRPGAAEEGTRRHPVFGRWMDQSKFRRRVWPEPNKEGYLVGPAVDEHEAEIADDYLEAITRLVRTVIPS